MTKGERLSIRKATRADMAAILEIVNDAILNSTAWYDDRPRALAEQNTWFDAKTASGWPVYVAHYLSEDEQSIIGFATFDTFRARPAYSRTVEHSVYISSAARGAGAGRRLMHALIEEAECRRHSCHDWRRGQRE
ncbi:N-acetyltransferase [Pacificimonas sp. WHA3]|uniref:N-acetyltransferase n=1 Tax=Pacificimonas pallii TaxID=2827236 RepID=A0ABS6SBH4_9SPHN|nr:GNAT family N-acetyltransferase [Pacificimonas pallii]MBV7255772.1 N-acetyltransferase [Pacificimonas pallii]